MQHYLIAVILLYLPVFVIGPFPSPSLSAIAAGKIQSPLDSMYRPGISAGISGTAYADSASVSSAVSSVRSHRSKGHRSKETTPAMTPVQSPSKRSEGEISLSQAAGDR